MKIEKQTYQISTDKKINIKICHISDIHFKNPYSFDILELLFTNIQKENPDYICITGDILDEPRWENASNIEVLYTFFKNICVVAPTICILGNHDEMSAKNHTYKKPYQFIKKVKKIPKFHLLDNEIYEDGSIRFIGYRQDIHLFKEEIKQDKNVQKDIQNKFPHSFSKEKYNIFLMHSPLIIGKSIVQKQIKVMKTVDLILCGHTHDGLVFSWLKSIYPKNRGIISPNKKLFPNRARGLICSKVPVLISGGVIKLGGTSGVFHHLNGLFKSSLTIIKIDK